MARYWALPTIANRLTSAHRTRVVTEDMLYRWVREGKLHSERIESNLRGHGKYALQVEEEQLKADLSEMGYDVDRLFPVSE